MKGWLLGLFCVTLLLAPGCSDPDREFAEIRKTLATRANALNSKDIVLYLSVVSPRYNDKDIQFRQLKENLEKNFRDFERISYEADTPSITVDGNRAATAGSYRMKVQVRGKEITVKGAEHLRLAREPEGWKIIAGI